MDQTYHVPYPEGKSRSISTVERELLETLGISQRVAFRSELRDRTENGMRRMNLQFLVGFDSTCTHVILLRFISMAK